MLPEPQRYKDTVRCVALGAKVQEHSRKTYDSNLDGAFVENTITQIRDWKKK